MVHCNTGSSKETVFRNHKVSLNGTIIYEVFLHQRSPWKLTVPKGGRRHLSKSLIIPVVFFGSHYFRKHEV
jgi:hypothetical protein